MRLDNKEAHTIIIVSHLDVSQFLQMNKILQYVHTDGEIFCQGWKMEEDEGVVRDKFSEEDTPPWEDFQ